MQKIPHEVYLIFTKTIVPALIAVSVGLAVKMKKSKISVKEALTSIIIGVGFAVILGPIIHDNFTETLSSAVIAGIAITGEKIGYWLIFKFNFDRIGDAIIDFVEYIIRKK